MFLFDDVEVGCGEIKPFNSDNQLNELDKYRISELCKRQLHGRMGKRNLRMNSSPLELLLLVCYQDRFIIICEANA